MADWLLDRLAAEARARLGPGGVVLVDLSVGRERAALADGRTLASRYGETATGSSPGGALRALGARVLDERPQS